VAYLRQAIETGYRDLRLITGDHDLNPLRSRSDFQQLKMDLAFPDNLFAT
jgi:hypothetical protein